jgi:hypothetical protein
MQSDSDNEVVEFARSVHTQTTKRKHTRVRSVCIQCNIKTATRYTQWEDLSTDPPNPEATEVNLEVKKIM